MGLGHAEVKTSDGNEHYIETTVNEHGQRWFYRGWAEWLAAKTWAELKQTRSPVPVGAF